MGGFSEIAFFTLATAYLSVGPQKDSVKSDYLPARVQLAKPLLGLERDLGRIETYKYKGTIHKTFARYPR